MNLTDRTQSKVLIDTLRDTGVKAPEVVEAYAKATRLSDGVRKMGAAPGLLGAAIASALAANRDPAADVEVQRLLALAAISNEGIIQSVDSKAFEDFRFVVVDQADSLVGGFRRPFDAAVKRLTEAHARMGDVDLADSATILRQGDNVAVVWADAQAAVQLVNTVMTGWVALAGLTRRAETGRHNAVLRMSAVSYGTWVSHELRERQLPVWDALIMGLDLSLPTFTQYGERIQVITDGRATAERHAQADNLALRTGRRPPVRIS